MIDYLSEFAEASRRSKVFCITDEGESQLRSFGTDWGLPSFHFGTLTHEHFGEQVGERTYGYYEDDSIGQALLAAAKRPSVLPFPHCIFIVDDPIDGQPELFELASSSQAMSVRTFYRLERNGVAHWFFEEDNLSTSFDGMWSFSVPTWVTNKCPWAVEEHKVIAGRKIRHIEIAADLLTIGQCQREPQISAVRDSVNRGRIKGKLAPIPVTTTIRVNRYVGSTAQGRLRIGSGSAKRPHYRRSHTRTLKSGKSVVVRPSAIHGGDSRREYRVII